MTGVAELRQKLLGAFASGNREAEAADALAAAICAVARHHGVSASPVAITAGLPLVGGRLPLEHVALAAARAGLAVDETVRTPLDLEATDLPAIAVDPAGHVRLLHAPDGEEDRDRLDIRFILIDPSPDGTREALTAAAAGMLRDWRSIVLRPVPADAELATSHPNNWLWAAFRQSTGVYAQAIAATMAINALALAVPLFSMNVYDRVLPNAAADTLWALALGLMLALVFELLIKHLRGEFVDLAGRRADVQLANFIYGRLLGARPDRITGSTGVRANSLREFESLREFFNSATLTAFGDLPFVLIFLVVMVYVSGALTLIVLAMIPLLMLVAWFTQRTLHRRMETAFRNAAQKNAVIVETLVGIESLKAARGESFAAGRYERATADQIRIGHEVRHVSNLGLHVMHLLQNLTQVLLVIAGFYMVQAGQLTAGALIAATMLAGRAMQPIGQAAALLARLNQARMAFKALSDIVHAEQERPAAGGQLVRIECKGRITFETVTHRYDPEAPAALAEVSFDIGPGERVAFVGGIGSGKSTALKLIDALERPTAGRVLLDGVAVTAIDPAVLRTHAALLPQGAELFSGTIRSNIAIADPGASDTAVIGAAAAVGAFDWIGRLPKGFDTPVRERGGNLSGGQRQLVALARAALLKPRVLLLDEPTADMDGRTEGAVIASLRAAFAGHTVIVTTHRPAVLDLVDRIIVFEGGRIILDGAKADVLRKLKGLTERRGAGTAGTAQAADRSGRIVAASHARDQTG